MPSRIDPRDGASLAQALLDLAHAGDLDLSDIETGDIEALRDALDAILSARR